MIAVATALGVSSRAGVHIGERALRDDADHVLDISAALASAATAGQLCVSRTIADLLPGSGLQFDARGQLAPSHQHNTIAVLSVRS